MSLPPSPGSSADAAPRPPARPHADLVELLATAPLFDRLPVRIREEVAYRGATRQIRAGAPLLTVGAMNRSLFLVVEGAVDVLLAGGEVPHVRLGRGECVGELSIIDGQPVSADVIAAVDSTLIELAEEHVWALIDSSATFARNLLRVLAGRVRHDHAALAESSGARRHYERLSMVDALTSLHNRRWFDTMFPQEVARFQEDDERGVLLMIDVDRFKDLNDAHGHAVGDVVLQRIAAVLNAGLRPADLLARIGGEEFMACVGRIDARAAHELAERLRLLVEGLRGNVPPCTVSIGLAEVLPGERFESLVRRADEALFRAKLSGRNRVSD